MAYITDLRAGLADDAYRLVDQLEAAVAVGSDVALPVMAPTAPRGGV